MDERVTKVIPGKVKHTYLTENEWVLKDPVLLRGEIAISYFSDNVTKFKVGNGTNLWSELPYTDSVIQSIIDDLNEEAAKNVMELQDPYLTTVDNVPCANITFNTDTNLAEVLTENWFPIIADDSVFATDIGLDNNAVPVFTDHFPLFVDSINDNTYTTMRDRVVAALKDTKSGFVYIVSTDTNVSCLYTLLKTDMTINYNSVDYTIPVVKYQITSAMTEEEKSNISSNLTDITDKLTETENRLNDLESMDAFNIVGYDSNNETVNEEWEFTSSDGTTMRTVKPYVTGIPVIPTITDTTDSSNISEADKALLAKYIDPEIATSTDTAWIDTVIGEYRTYITNNSTDGVFNKKDNIGDTYIDLPTTSDPNYSMATLVGYEENGATVYKWVHHKSEHDIIDALENKVTQAETEIETIKDTFATKEEMNGVIKNTGGMLKLMGVVDDKENIPGYRCMEVTREYPFEDLFFTGMPFSMYDSIYNNLLAQFEQDAPKNIGVGSVYLVGDESVNNKAEYALVMKDYPDDINDINIIQLFESSYITTDYTILSNAISDVDLFGGGTKILFVASNGLNDTDTLGLYSLYYPPGRVPADCYVNKLADVPTNLNLNSDNKVTIFKWTPPGRTGKNKLHLVDASKHYIFDNETNTWSESFELPDYNISASTIKNGSSIYSYIVGKNIPGGIQFWDKSEHTEPQWQSLYKIVNDDTKEELSTTFYSDIFNVEANEYIDSTIINIIDSSHANFFIYKRTNDGNLSDFKLYIGYLSPSSRVKITNIGEILEEKYPEIFNKYFSSNNKIKTKTIEDALCTYENLYGMNSYYILNYSDTENNDNYERSLLVIGKNFEFAKIIMTAHINDINTDIPTSFLYNGYTNDYSLLRGKFPVVTTKNKTTDGIATKSYSIKGVGKAIYDTKYWWEYLGKVTDVDLNNYYTKDAIDNLLNTSITDLGTVLNYKGSVKAMTDLPVLTDCDFVSGYTIINDDQFESNKTTLEGLLETNNIKIGDVYFVGTNFSNTIGYVFRSFTTDTGDITYVWQPLGKIYDADINNLKTRLTNLELLKVLNINNIVGTIGEIPGGVTNTMYYSADTVNTPDPIVYEKLANVVLDGSGYKATELAHANTYEGSILFNYENEIYALVVNYHNGDLLFKYDINSNSWTNICTSARKSTYHPPRVINYNNKIYFTGSDATGERDPEGDDPSQCLYLFDKDAGSISKIVEGKLPFTVFNNSNIIFVYNNKIYLRYISNAPNYYDEDSNKFLADKNLYEYSGTTWTKVENHIFTDDLCINTDNPVKSYLPIILNNKIYLFRKHDVLIFTGITSTDTYVSVPYSEEIGDILYINYIFTKDNNIYFVADTAKYSYLYFTMNSSNDSFEIKGRFPSSITDLFKIPGDGANTYSIKYSCSNLDDDVYIVTYASTRYDYNLNYDDVLKFYKFSYEVFDNTDNFNAIIDYHNTFKTSILDNYDLGDIIYVAPDLNTTTLADINLDAATPYMLLGYKVNLPMYAGADTSTTPVTDAEELYAYKWVQLPNTATISSVDKRLELLEFNVESNTESITDHESRIDILEKAGYATESYVDQKVSDLGRLLNIKGILTSVDLLPGYATNPEVMNGITEEELAALVEATGLSFKVGDTYLVDNGDNTNKIEYTWSPITVQVPNPDYVDKTTTPDSDPTLPVTKYKWEPLGSISGLDLESYYTKALADDLFLRKDDASVVRTTDRVIIDGDDDATGDPSGPSYSTVPKTPINFTKAETLSNIKSGEDLSQDMGKIARWYDELVELRKEMNKTIKPSSITHTLTTTDWIANEEPETGFSAKMELEGAPFMGNIGLCSDYTEEEYNAVTDSNLQVAGYNEETKELIFTVDAVPTIDIRVEMVYIIDRSTITTN